MRSKSFFKSRKTRSKSRSIQTTSSEINSCDLSNHMKFVKTLNNYFLLTVSRIAIAVIAEISVVRLLYLHIPTASSNQAHWPLVVHRITRSAPPVFCLKEIYKKHFKTKKIAASQRKTYTFYIKVEQKPIFCVFPMKKYGTRGPTFQKLPK